MCSSHTTIDFFWIVKEHTNAQRANHQNPERILVVDPSRQKQPRQLDLVDHQKKWWR